jgi:hydroxymethylglutaryl-CoA lyase
MLQRMGFETGIDLPRLLETSRWLQTVLEHSVPGMLVKAGVFPVHQPVEKA